MAEEGAEAGASGRRPREGLGAALTAAREGKSLSVGDAAERSKVPKHYIEMLEAGDYALISDQLYLVPFLRRYATFLELDPDGLTINFVREVQRAEGAALRSYEPPKPAGPGRAAWITTAIVMLFIIVAVYVALGMRRQAALQPMTEPEVSPAAEASPSLPGAPAVPEAKVTVQITPSPAAAAAVSRSTAAGQSATVAPSPAREPASTGEEER